MAIEKVLKLKIKRKAGYLYYLNPNGGVFCMPIEGDRAKGRAKAEKVAETSFHREPGYLYFVDAQGDVSRSRL